jgi:hypothetical protein
MPSCYVFDLDGTIANLDHRLHYIQKEAKDWRGFFAAVGDDSPIEPIVTLMRNLYAGPDGYPHLVILSGRSSECRDTTRDWLQQHNVPYHYIYMRAEGDHRPDFETKKDMLDLMLKDNYIPLLFVDDRNQVVDLWRALGYTCLQCAKGDF